MTPHQDMPLRREVGVRELHDQLSRYVRHAADGGEVIVTMRGKPVARLTPLPSADPFATLRARGLIQEPTRPRTTRFEDADMIPLEGDGPTASDIVIQMRRGGP
ncbi:MAG TPA: type II toxin-antitoxin system prevent-host-death family antitoxin [Conexibacter sp.]|nr:type II toxin-antitoxin system prevent-host-death family antitoxin [Conexibacter sp.]